jgi:steroid delta-isomerase-like uncharacterized protein
MVSDRAVSEHRLATQEPFMNNQAIAEQYFQAVTSRNVDAALACFAPDAQFRTPLGPAPFPDGIRGMLHGYDSAFPGSRFEVENAVESGDQVVLEGTWIGRHTGPMQLPDGRTLPATGREVRAPFATVFRLRNGKLVAHRAYWDLASFMAQLG